MRCRGMNSAPATSGKMAMVGSIAASAVVASAATPGEAMSAPAVAIAPPSPWAHTQEDPVIEISRSIVAIGRAGVGRVVVIAIGADWLNA